MRAAKRIVTALLCLACGWGGAQAAEFSAGGAIVRFPMPVEQINQTRDDSGQPTYWQRAPTPQDPQRVLVFHQLNMPFWMGWFMRVVPEAMMDRAGDKLIEAFQAAGKTGRRAPIEDPQWVEINGHPGWTFAVQSPGQNQPVARPDGQPPRLGDYRYMSALLLWTGESLVIAGVGGNQPVADDEFLQSVRTTTTVEPGDAQAQFNLLCTAGGLALPALLLLLIVLVYVIDKSIKRRKRARTAA
jgi:hypothetical protein